MTSILNQSEIYSKGDQQVWKGRVDGIEREWMRWHQLIDCVDLSVRPDLHQAATLLGFCSDEGVSRNQGRLGAKDGPAAIRRVLANLPVHFSDKLKLKDAGDISINDNDLEASQEVLGRALKIILEQGGFPIVLGGGHEVTYGHYLGIRDFLKDRNESLGIINLDAHLDIRNLNEGKGNSGTGFYQIAQDRSQNNHQFRYLAIGIQEISNTKGLFAYAREKNAQIIERKNICNERLSAIQKEIHDFSRSVDYVYLTIDLDVFAAPYAPGVSASAFNGIVPDALFFRLYESILSLPNLKSMDLAELNPYFDIDSRTAKLASDLIFRFVNRF